MCTNSHKYILKAFKCVYTRPGKSSLENGFSRKSRHTPTDLSRRMCTLIAQVSSPVTTTTVPTISVPPPYSQIVPTPTPALSDPFHLFQNISQMELYCVWLFPLSIIWDSLMLFWISVVRSWSLVSTLYKSVCGLLWFPVWGCFELAICTFMYKSGNGLHFHFSWVKT